MPIHPDHPHWATASHDRWAWGRKYRMWNTAMDYGAYLYELGETEADARRSMQNSLDGWYRVDAEGQGSGVSGGSALRSSRLIGELVVYCEAADGFDYSFYLCRVPAGARPLHALDAFASQWKSQMMHHRQQLQSALGATVWPGR